MDVACPIHGDEVEWVLNEQKLEVGRECAIDKDLEAQGLIPPRGQATTNGSTVGPF
jgi:hypothetical protein